MEALIFYAIVLIAKAAKLLSLPFTFLSLLSQYPDQMRSFPGVNQAINACIIVGLIAVVLIALAARKEKAGLALLLPLAGYCGIIAAIHSFGELPTKGTLELRTTSNYIQSIDRLQNARTNPDDLEQLSSRLLSMTRYLTERGRIDLAIDCLQERWNIGPQGKNLLPTAQKNNDDWHRKIIGLLSRESEARQNGSTGPTEREFLEMHIEVPNPPFQDKAGITLPPDLCRPGTHSNKRQDS